MFKFNFSVAEGSDGRSTTVTTTTGTSATGCGEGTSLKHGSSNTGPSNEARGVPMVECEGLETRKDARTQIVWERHGATLVRAVPATSVCSIPTDTDLVPGVYEGGLKVWEASLDLVDYLTNLSGDVQLTAKAPKIRHREQILRSLWVCKTRNTGKTRQALELGCGHGLPGIMALRQGFQVCFSDYNGEVITEVTIPNVRHNVARERWNLAEFFCGDWETLSPLLEERNSGGKFDLILSAETLYNTSVAQKVVAMIAKHLARGGLALVASKRFYFGTGGSTDHFRGMLAAEGRLECINVMVVDTGRGNIREVLAVFWKDGFPRSCKA